MTATGRRPRLAGIDPTDVLAGAAVVTVADPTFIDATDATVAYTFGGHDAIAQIVPGEPVRLRTLDCFAGNVRSVKDLPSQVCTFPQLNPVTGPLYVAGAKPGDTLAVHLIDLTPVGDVGFSATFPHFGALTGTDQTAMLHPPLEEVVWEYPIDHALRMVRFTARKTLVEGAHGGNLDTPMWHAGATLYLPVSVEGAMLAVGDGHARQGDGELCGVAVEVPMDVTLVVEVVSEIATPWPRLETDESFGSIGVARPLEDAYRGGNRRLVQDVCAMTGLDPLDAYQLVSQTGKARIGNVVDTEYTIVAALDKWLFDGARPYRGAHQRLRAIGKAS
jgi:amidase